MSPRSSSPATRRSPWPPSRPASPGTGYPGTPSTENPGGVRRARRSRAVVPQRKGGAGGRAGRGVRRRAGRSSTMKHVGVNVAADPLFTAAYTGVSGALVVVSADDPGLASSQNEQDNRRYARRGRAAAMLEPADSQEAYDFSRRGRALRALEAAGAPPHDHPRLPLEDARPIARHARASRARSLRARHRGPGHDPVQRAPAHQPAAPEAGGHRGRGTRLSDLNRRPARRAGARASSPSGVAYIHAARGGAGGQLPQARARLSAAAWSGSAASSPSVERCVVIEEGDPVWSTRCARPASAVEGEAGEVPLRRARRGAGAPHPRQGRPPEPAARAGSRRSSARAARTTAVYRALRKLDCIVAGDIGCYSLGVCAPFQAMDTCVCMGASLGVGLGLRHALPAEQARRVVSVIGDSTFVHSGLTGLVEMVYNPPTTGHVVIILDNGTTAMTGSRSTPARAARWSTAHREALHRGPRPRHGVPSVTVLESATPLRRASSGSSSSGSPRRDLWSSWPAGPASWSRPTSGNGRRRPRRFVPPKI